MRRLHFINFFAVPVVMAVYSAGYFRYMIAPFRRAVQLRMFYAGRFVELTGVERLPPFWLTDIEQIADQLAKS